MSYPVRGEYPRLAILVISTQLKVTLETDFVYENPEGAI